MQARVNLGLYLSPENVRETEVSTAALTGYEPRR